MTSLDDYARRLADFGVREPVADWARDDLKLGRQHGSPLDLLQQRWYASLDSGSPDYGVYEAEAYLAELWVCWATYSRHYLGLLAKRGLPAFRSVADLGCGIGYSTLTLHELLPDADIYGTNVAGLQADFARSLGVDVREQVTGPVEAMFASEYFEHFYQPVAHLAHVLAVARPRVLIIANAFTAPAIGHFPMYRVGRDVVPGSVCSRRFNSYLRERGYSQAPPFWNGRPVMWIRKPLLSASF